ncbi:hypothetical protein CYMTET_12592 [Cymbomonas tetramitiformis]|uniref:Ubiquitin-like protease family profile domain-containing protein n=1 Tax=Cymbomonas tetramitiformis TaxID=36881 RepID=A0AAE0LC09_9CHLO|nr:hypothetical protein CYMTET_12592 [Cymbomonas tetramitiformis]
MMALGYGTMICVWDLKIDTLVSNWLSALWEEKTASQDGAVLSSTTSRDTAPVKRFHKRVMPLRKPDVPQQTNHTDCGVFVLHYLEQFCKSAPKRVWYNKDKHKLEVTCNSTPGCEMRDVLTERWFPSRNAGDAKRAQLRDRVIDLAHRQHADDIYHQNSSQGAGSRPEEVEEAEEHCQISSCGHSAGEVTSVPGSPLDLWRDTDEREGVGVAQAEALPDEAAYGRSDQDPMDEVAHGRSDQDPMDEVAHGRSDQDPMDEVAHGRSDQDPMDDAWADEEARVVDSSGLALPCDRDGRVVQLTISIDGGLEAGLQHNEGSSGAAAPQPHRQQDLARLQARVGGDAGAADEAHQGHPPEAAGADVMGDGSLAVQYTGEDAGSDDDDENYMFIPRDERAAADAWAKSDTNAPTDSPEITDLRPAAESSQLTVTIEIDSDAGDSRDAFASLGEYASDEDCVENVAGS